MILEKKIKIEINQTFIVTKQKNPLNYIQQRAFINH